VGSTMPDLESTETPTPTRPLAGMRVLDGCQEKGEFAGRILSDLGAEVWRLEPPGGAGSRGRAPFAEGDAEGVAEGEGRGSLHFALRNLGEGSLTLDLEQPEGRELLHRLLERMDVWLESSKPGFLEANELAPADVCARHPRLVLTSVTDFGRTGPYRDYEGTDMIGFAMGGMMHKAGAPHRPPVVAPGNLAYDAAGICALFPTLMACYQRMKTGRGQHIDVSVVESVASTSDWGIPNASLNPGIQARMGAGIYPLYRCADGFARMVILVTAHWRALLEWMGHPEELMDPKYDQFLERLMAGHVINPVVERFFSTMKKTDVCVEGQRRGLPITPLLEPGEVLNNAHTSARGTFAERQVEGRSVSLPSGFLHIDGQRIGPSGDAPAPGADNEAVYEALGVDAARRDELRGLGVI